jgi:hypothetical protein
MNDSLTPDTRFSTSPFAEYGEPALPPLTVEADAPEQHIHHQKLARLRASPLARMLRGSPWLLKAYQLDMDCPPTPGDFIDQKLIDLLQKHSGSNDAIDRQTIHNLFVEFNSDSKPEVEHDGTEHYACRLTISQLARTQDPGSFWGLIRTMEADRPLSPQLPTLTLRTLVQWLTTASWMNDYRQLLAGFWIRHASTYRLLATLSFLDGLIELNRKRRISREGYTLALNVLGLERFPRSLAELTTPAENRRAVLSMVSLNGKIVPGVFQLESNATSHSFIHVLGETPACIEYINNDMSVQTLALIDALNTSPWHCLHVDTEVPPEATAELSIVESHKHAFELITHLQRQFSLDRLESSEHEHLPCDDSLSMPIQRALNIIAVMDIWATQAPLHTYIPDPLHVANRLMGKHLQQQYNLTLDPQHVFIRYQHGNNISALGHARAPVTHVQVPDETPISLGQALISQYRVAYPVGYIDEGAESLVYLDPSKKGDFSEHQRLPVQAQALEQFIQGVDFLQAMTQKLERFWEKKRTTIRRSLRATFIIQALLSLKRGALSRGAFDILVKMLDEAQLPVAQRQIRCSALGFYVQHSSLQGAQCVFCPGLMVFRHKDEPGCILYQAGHQEAFVEFSQRAQLTAHLVSRAADPGWRKTLMDYVPQRLHSRLGYILELWGRTREPVEPVSLLRPWTDLIYNEDAHLAIAGQHGESAPVLAPFSYLRDTLHSNSLSDAQDSISTAKEVSLQYWTEQLLRLQRLLAPLSLLLAPAAIASLMAGAATLALTVQAATLPGIRRHEKRQVVLTLLSFGLLKMAPPTQGLMRSLRSFIMPIKPAAKIVNTSTRGFNWQLRRSMNLRRTQLEHFFGNGNLLKTWTVPGYPNFATFPVKAWKLERKFVLWTSDRAQARTLVVSSHGYYLPWSNTTAIPNGTELRIYAPHGFELVDPRLHRIVSQKVQPFAVLNNNQNLPGPAARQLSGWQMTDKLLAGTSQPGRFKNYTLAKFQSEQYESYRDISNIVRHSHQSPFFGQLMPTPMDVLTVRNRFGMSNPGLQDLFGALSRQGIHYDHILLVHCRCPAISSLMGRAPSFEAPLAYAPITP